MDQGKTVKKTSESKSGGSRRRVRPSLRWLEDVEKDLREIKFERWRQNTFDREERTSVFKGPRFSEGRRRKELRRK